MSLKKISYFFEKTATTFARGFRFLTDDKPSESVFRMLFDAITFRSESSHRAKVDTDVFVDTNNGHVTLANDTQTDTRALQPTDRSIVVQPHQVPTLIEGDGVTLTKETTPEGRVNVTVNSTAGPSVTAFALTLEELNIPSDTEIICIYDTSSFTDATSRPPAQDLIASWYKSYVTANPNFLGNLIEIEEGNERYLTYATDYATETYINACTTTTPAQALIDTFTGLRSPVLTGAAVGNSVPISVYKKKFVVIAFIDEAGYGAVEKYHTILKANTAEVATTTFKNDYAAFLAAHANVDFFKGIIYPARGIKLNEEVGTFHAHLTKTLTKGTLLTPPALTAAQSADGWTTEMNFMTTSNPYTADGVDTLADYGWSSTQASLTTPQIDSITQAEFDNQVILELESATGSKTIRINGKITMSDTTEFDSTIEFDVAVP